MEKVKERLQLLRADADAANKRAEAAEAKNKHYEQEIDLLKTENEGLQKKVQLLEDELDKAISDLKDTREKLRQLDVRAENSERQIARLEEERDRWEKKYEEMQEKYRESKRELDEVVAAMEGL
ncbi:hypothetical protein BN946_scf185008.g17 [Trametes cinnabarina]|uniref:Tropomyosin n=1 Tax=Pycnoporus cinnabarinus TaxID=5643 RepID=A0A060SFV9_PYCCI|nr:hypothetical protein BN946_scf185008.g17 [Trametes cinnabarina]